MALCLSSYSKRRHKAVCACTVRCVAPPVLCVQNSAELPAMMLCCSAKGMSLLLCQGDASAASLRAGLRGHSRARSRGCRAPQAAASPRCLPRCDKHRHTTADGDSISLMVGTDMTYHGKTLSYLYQQIMKSSGIFRKKVARPKMLLIPDFCPRRHAKPYQASLQQQL